MPEIVICEFTTEESVADLKRDYNVHYDPDLVDDPAALAGLLANARALIVRNRTRVDAALLDSAPKLVAVGRLGVGLENIDLDTCHARGVTVFPAHGANTVSVAEYVIASLLLLLRGAFGASDRVIVGEWPRAALTGCEAAGRRLGIAGFGATGRAVAKRAAALDMTIAAFDPLLAPDDPAWAGVERATMDALITGSDVLSLHVPLVKETRGLIDATAIGIMKPGAILINAARGGIVDEPALAEALRSGHLGGAALDVFTQEPLDAAIGGVFAGVPNLILTPHIAGITEESNQRTGMVTAASVRQALEAASSAANRNAGGSTGS